MNYRKFSQNKAGDTINYSCVQYLYLKILSCIKEYTLDTLPILINSLYLKLLVFQSKLSGIRKDTLKYKLSEMSFDLEISRVDYISNEKYYSHFSNTRR